MSDVNLEIMNDAQTAGIVHAAAEPIHQKTRSRVKGVAEEFNVSESRKDGRRMNRFDHIESLKDGFRRQDVRDKELFEHLPDILNSARTFVDVGASVGIYTFHANDHIHGGRIYAIEPEPVRYDELKKRCMKWQS